MSSKEVADLVLRVPDGSEEFHLVAGVVRDGAGVVTSHGNSRRGTLAALAAFILGQVPARLRLIAFFFTTTPTSSEVLGLYVAVDAFTLPANMAGSQVKVGTNPTAVFAIDVQQNGASIGTISISTGGVPTLTTSGGTAKAIAAADVLKFVAPVGADATIANVAVNLKGTL